MPASVMRMDSNYNWAAPRSAALKSLQTDKRKPFMLDIVIETRSHDLGGGFEVGRVLPFRQRRMVGPFVFFDRMGPHDLHAPVPEQFDVLPHPHIGLATVTYLFQGEMTHRDSLGVEQIIRPGALNWMMAGSGISHSERFDGMRPKGGVIDGIQAWVALPESHEEAAPTFNHYPPDALPIIDEAGWQGRLIAGSAYGQSSPSPVYSPLFYLHVQAGAGAQVPLPDTHPERAAYVASGRVEYQGQTYQPGQMLVFAPQATGAIRVVENTQMMLLGGEPVGPRHIWWNFVSSSKERIEQAKADWQAGRFQLPPHDKDKVIPLPSV